MIDELLLTISQPEIINLKLFLKGLLKSNVKLFNYSLLSKRERERKEFTKLYSAYT